MSGRGEPRLRNAGEAAFVVEFGNEISVELNERATALAALLEREPFDGFREAIPTFRSVLVFHDPEADPEAIRAHALDLARGAGREPARPPRHIELPCVYDGEDLPEVAAQAGVSVEELIRIHSEREYRVFIIGFTPGFPYLGMADPRLDIPRRSVPRVRVPAGAVAMARAQTGIYPWVTPGGWHLLGRMDPALLFDPGKSPPSGCLPGDQVRFLPVAELPERPAAETAAPPPPEGRRLSRWSAAASSPPSRTSAVPDTSATGFPGRERPTRPPSSSRTGRSGTRTAPRGSNAP